MEWIEQMHWLGAFLVGLLGGVHCLGMCGGIVTAVAIQPGQPTTLKPKLSILFGYNFGRLFSYMVAGILMGALGQSIFSMLDLQHTKQVMGMIAATLLLLLGIYLSGIWNGLSWLERGGAKLWKIVEPFGRKFIPTKSFSQAVPLGMVWGWIPCGMVYTILTWAIFTGSWIQGGLLMLAFGIGTLPNLLMMGLAADKLNHVRQSALIRRIAGGLVAIMAFSMMYNLFFISA